MDIANAKTRANAGMLASLVGRKVLLVGRVQNVAGDVATVTAADGGSVQVKLAPALGAALDAPVVEFEGVVRGPADLEETARSSFGANFDMAAYNELVAKAATTYKPIFV